MTLAHTSDLMAAADAAGTALPAFNVITIEHAEGVAAGAERARSSVLIQISENTVKFHGGRLAPLLSACAQIATQSTTPLAIHLDHFQDIALITEAIDTAAALGASSIMVDAAHLPFHENISETKLFRESAHVAGLYVEAELGEVGGKDGAHAPGVRTDPAEAAAFVDATGVDALAVAVGSSHAMTTRDADLDHDLISRLAAAVNVPLVLHGSSGVPDHQLRSAVAAGIRKINIGTALNVAYTSAIRDMLSANATATDPRKYLTLAREAVCATVADLCRVVAAVPAQGTVR